MQDSEAFELHASYLHVVAAIRAFEPELRTKLLDPLVLIRGVVDVDWRIKSWDSMRAKLSHKRSHQLTSFDVSDISDLLGVRVIIAERQIADAVCDLIARVFHVADDVRYHNSGGPPKFYREHLTVDAVGEEGILIRFEVQIRSTVAQAVINAEHALSYGRDDSALMMSNMSRTTLGRDISQAHLSEVVNSAVSGATRLDAIIDKFEKMITDPGVHEKRDIHPYLDEHRFLLHAGPDSIVSEPAIGLGTQYRLDFIIREPTGEYVLVELENPRHLLFTAAAQPRAEVTHAVQQVEDWQHWIEQNIQTVQRVYPDISSPAGLIVIGRSTLLSDEDKQRLARRNINMRGRLKIETYDEVVIRARAYVTGIRRALNS